MSALLSRLAAGCLLLLAAVACQPQATATPGAPVPGETAQPDPFETVAPEPSGAGPGTAFPTMPPAVLTDTLSYRNAAAGFALDYPASWHVVDVAEEVKTGANPYSVSFMSWSPETGGQGIPENGTKLDLGVLPGAGASVEAAVALYRTQLASASPAANIVSEEEWTLPSGLKGTRFLIETDMGQSAVFVTSVDGDALVLSGLGDLDLFDAVARSLRPIRTG